MYIVKTLILHILAKYQLLVKDLFLLGKFVYFTWKWSDLILITKITLWILLVHGNIIYHC